MNRHGLAMRRMGFVLLLSGLLLVGFLLAWFLFTVLQDSKSPTAEQAKATASFAVLKAGQVNVRRGPGFDHAVQWIYRRRGVPVAIIDRFGHWRHIRDMDGDTGWVHFSLLDASARGAMVRRADSAPLPLRAQASAEAQVVALLQPGVVLEPLECLPDWCRVRIGERRGWVMRASLWGIAADDLFRQGKWWSRGESNP